MKNHDVTSQEEAAIKIESPTKTLKKKKSSIQALSFEEPPAQLMVRYHKFFQLFK